MKGSVLGAGCRVGTRVKIHQCVLMDNVTVSDGVTLTNTIVCSHATVQVRRNDGGGGGKGIKRRTKTCVDDGVEGV
jgi:translation initiation factor eIF-2B subunit gamma